MQFECPLQSCYLLLEVEGNIAELLFDVTHNLPLGCGCEGVTPLCEDLHDVICEVTASQILPLRWGHQNRAPYPWYDQRYSSK
ncbi:acetolactate synthase small subunit [Elysia marginata]|uniref:Acetolactate synthase small subunit n=1 Tax=Elysia marginata TaxID=1093978 RepID=A0AAV4JUJ0_9GAST|nr:acetolactate synthase small subunit [Elysia marginata]